MIGRTGKRYRGNSEPYDPSSALPRDRAVIQAQAGPRNGIAWVDIRLEVEGHFLATSKEVELRDVVEGQQTWDPDEAFNTSDRRFQEAATRAYFGGGVTRRDADYTSNCTKNARNPASARIEQ